MVAILSVVGLLASSARAASPCAGCDEYTLDIPRPPVTNPPEVVESDPPPSPAPAPAAPVASAAPAPVASVPAVDRHQKKHHQAKQDRHRRGRPQHVRGAATPLPLAAPIVPGAPEAADAVWRQLAGASGMVLLLAMIAVGLLLVEPTRRSGASPRTQNSR